MADYPASQLAYVLKRERDCMEHILTEFARRLHAEPDFWSRYEQARMLRLERRALYIEGSEHDDFHPHWNGRR